MSNIRGTFQIPEIRHLILIQESVSSDKINRPMVFALPEEQGAVSVPNGFFHELVCRNSLLPTSALAQSIKPSGRLYWQMMRDFDHRAPSTIIKEFEEAGLSHVRDRISTAEIQLTFER